VIDSPAFFISQPPLTLTRKRVHSSTLQLPVFAESAASEQAAQQIQRPSHEPQPAGRPALSWRLGVDTCGKLLERRPGFRKISPRR